MECRQPRNGLFPHHVPRKNSVRAGITLDYVDETVFNILSNDL